MNANKREKLAPASAALISLLALLIAILTGCSESSGGRWNIPGVGGSGHLEGRVSTPGQSKHQSETLYAKAGQDIIIKYAVARQAGSLSIAIYTTKLTVIADRLWGATLRASATNEVHVPIQKPGNHKILINLSGFAGTYDISWKNK